MDPISGALAGASLISGISGGKSAQKSANKAAASQKEVAKRALQLFDKMFGIAEDADKAGSFDADSQIKQLEKDTARYESEDLGNLAGASRVMGYAPGDSVVKDMLQNIKVQYRTTLDNARTALRKASVFDKLGAYGAAGQSGTLGTAGQIYGQQYNAAAQRSQGTNTGGLFGAIMPFLSPTTRAGYGTGQDTGGLIGANI